MRRLVLAAVLIIVVLPSFADSITFSTFALQNGGGVSVPLGPGLDPLLVPAFSGPENTPLLIFETKFVPVGTVVSSYTLDVPGLDSTLGPYTVVCTVPTGCGEVGQIYAWSVPPRYRETPGTLSATLNGVSETYDFRYQQPVPEPTTLALLGTGLMAALAESLREYRNRSGQ
jgi:hypothetical protein